MKGTNRPGIQGGILTPVFFAVLLLATGIFTCSCDDTAKNVEPLPTVDEVRVEIENGNYNCAVMHLEKIVEAEPDNLYAWQLLGRAMVSRGDTFRAIELYTVVLDKWPNDPESRHERAVLYLNLNRFDDALPDLVEYVKHEPNDSQALFDIGYTYNGYEDFETAVPYLTRYIELEPGDYRGWSQRGYAYSQLWMNEEAIADCNRALELNPDDAGSYGNRANAYYRSGQVEKAFEDYQVTIDLDRENYLAWYYRGIAWLGEDEPGAAVFNLRKSIEIESNYWATHFYLGIALQKQGAWRDAKFELELALRINPDAEDQIRPELDIVDRRIERLDNRAQNAG